MKWTKNGDHKEDKCDHDRYFVCSHPDVNCKDHTGGNTVIVGGSDGAEDACPADKTCVNTDGGYRCENAQDCDEGQGTTDVYLQISPEFSLARFILVGYTYWT